MTLSRNIRYYGQDRAPQSTHAVRAGPLSLIIDGVDLRYIRIDAREMLRRIYVAVRDPNWDTIPAAYTNLNLQVDDAQFDLSFDAIHEGNRIDFAWHGRVSGRPDGSIIYAMEGQARATFLKNRIGICVLHPMDGCAGQACAILGSDGSWREAAFPRYIAPCQPTPEFTAIAHEAMPGVRAEVRLSGDVFEMEDQRNWTDASFKTFSTPLRLPYPAEVPEGAQIAQSLTLTLQGSIPQQVSHVSGNPSLTLEPAITYPLPRLGLGMARRPTPLSEREIAHLSALHLSHLRADLDLAEPAWAQALDEATLQARAIGADLELALFVSDDAQRELLALSGVMQLLQPTVRRWLLFHKATNVTPEWVVRTARPILSACRPEAAFGAGTNVYFYDLNVARPSVEALDAVSFAITPQVHATDTASLVETLAAQQVTLESARQVCGLIPLAVSPVTLKPRFNPDALGPELALGQLPACVDVRQLSLFGAGWTVGSLKYLARGRAVSMTYYETTGWRGVMENAAWLSTAHGVPVAARHALPTLSCSRGCR